MWDIGQGRRPLPGFAVERAARGDDRRYQFTRQRKYMEQESNLFD